MTWWSLLGLKIFVLFRRLVYLRGTHQLLCLSRNIVMVQIAEALFVGAVLALVLAIPVVSASDARNLCSVRRDLAIGALGNAHPRDSLGDVSGAMNVFKLTRVSATEQQTAADWLKFRIWRSTPNIMEGGSLSPQLAVTGKGEALAATCVALGGYPTPLQKVECSLASTELEAIQSVGSVDLTANCSSVSTGVAEASHRPPSAFARVPRSCPIRLMDMSPSFYSAESDASPTSYHVPRESLAPSVPMSASVGGDVSQESPHLQAGGGGRPSADNVGGVYLSPIGARLEEQESNCDGVSLSGQSLRNQAYRGQSKLNLDFVWVLRRKFALGEWAPCK